MTDTFPPTHHRSFWDRVVVLGDQPEDCWEWNGEVDWRGYGRLSFQGRTRTAHRVSWYLSRGAWPQNSVCHKCDNRLCVRPSHHFDGTNTENLRDAAAKGRLGKDLRIIQEEDLPDIDQRITRGEAIQRIADDYGVSKFSIYNRKLGRTFRHVPFGGPYP